MAEETLLAQLVDQPGNRFPFVKLETAVGRAKQLYDAAAEHRMTVQDAFQTWSYSEKSSGGNQTISALKMYGLIDDSGYNEQRRIFLSPDGLRYFRDEREEALVELRRKFALEPPLMRALWDKWGVTPPADNIARSYLKIDRKMSDQNARSALGIYKENIDFANLKTGGKIAEKAAEKVKEINGGTLKTLEVLPDPPPALLGKAVLMAGERELTTGLLAKDASFRLIVTGNIGVKEIERLIKKLELDKEILADNDEVYGEEE